MVSESTHKMLLPASINVTVSALFEGKDVTLVLGLALLICFILFFYPLKNINSET